MWAPICIWRRRRPWLLDHVDVIMGTIARPDHRVADPIPGRECFYRQP
jgi:hypothetical protein